jgi:hypothetical protein
VGLLTNIAGTLLSTWEVGLGSIKTTMTSSASGLAVDRPLTPSGFGAATVVTSSDVLLANQVYAYIDASGANRVVTLPDPATISVGRLYVVQKTDATTNTVTITPTLATINGSATFVVRGTNDTVTVQYNGVEWRIVDFLQGDALAVDDPTRTLILDHSASDFSGAADRAAAEADAQAQSILFDLTGFNRFVISVDLTNVGTGPATVLNVFARQSGMAAPDVAVAADWTHFALPNPDRNTGVVTANPYEVQIPITAVDQFALSFAKWGTFGSVLVWVDAPAGTRGQVFVQRFTR